MASASKASTTIRGLDMHSDGLHRWHVKWSGSWDLAFWIVVLILHTWPMWLSEILIHQDREQVKTRTLFFLILCRLHTVWQALLGLKKITVVETLSVLKFRLNPTEICKNWNFLTSYSRKNPIFVFYQSKHVRKLKLHKWYTNFLH